MSTDISHIIARAKLVYCTLLGLLKVCVLVQLLMELIRNKVCIIYDIHFILYQLLLSIRIMIILLDERSSAGFSCVMSDCLCGTD